MFSSTLIMKFSSLEFTGMKFVRDNIIKTRDTMIQLEKNSGVKMFASTLITKFSSLEFTRMKVVLDNIIKTRDTVIRLEKHRSENVS